MESGDRNPWSIMLVVWILPRYGRYGTLQVGITPGLRYPQTPTSEQLPLFVSRGKRNDIEESLATSPTEESVPKNNGPAPNSPVTVLKSRHDAWLHNHIDHGVTLRPIPPPTL